MRSLRSDPSYLARFRPNPHSDRRRRGSRCVDVASWPKLDCSIQPGYTNKYKYGNRAQPIAIEWLFIQSARLD